MSEETLTADELKQQTADAFAVLLAHLRKLPLPFGVIIITASGHHRQFAANMAPDIASNMLVEIVLSGALQNAEVDPHNMRPMN